MLSHHYPDVPLVGDFTKIRGDEYGPVDLTVGGTPCQDYSIAGLREGLAGERGNLTLEFSRLSYRARSRWLAWENVPGVFSTNGGRDFGAILATFSGRHGLVFEPPASGWRNSGIVEQVDSRSYGLAWCVLDAQHFGVPQRRRRVFVVGHLGDWRRAAAVLFERHSLSGDSPPRREKGQNAPTIPSRSSAGGGLGTDFDCDGGLIASTGNTSHCLNAGGMGRQDYETETLIAHSLRAEGFDASEDGTGRGTPIVPVAIQERAVSENPDAGPDGAGFRDDGQAYTLEARTVPQAVCFAHQQGGSIDLHMAHDQALALQRCQGQAVCFTAKDHGADAGELSPTLRAGGHSGSHANAGVMPAVALYDDPRRFDARGIHGGFEHGDLHPPLNTVNSQQILQQVSAVRRLTPRECERLQGFPDDFTLVPYRNGMMKDGPRYKMLGNSMAVPVVRWIGERIALVDALAADAERAAA